MAAVAAAAYEPVQKHRVTPSTLGWLNNQLEFELNTVRKNICNRLHDDTLQNYFKKIVVDNFPLADSIDCEYYDDDQFMNLSKDNRSQLTIFHMNIRKFSKYRGKLLAYLNSLGMDFDIIVLSEIGSDAAFYFSSILSDYTCVYELPDGNNYGGVAVYVNPELSVSERDDLKIVKTCTCSKCKVESVWIDVIKNNETFTIGGVYRHQGGNPAHFDTALEVTFNKIAKNETCVITGDMNINLLNIDGAITTDYISSVMSHGFIPYITRPTRITEYTATLIDHLFIKLPHHQMTAPVKAGILFNDMTDHLPIFALLSFQDKSLGSQRPKMRIFSDTNIEKFKDKIAMINWNHVLNRECGNINCSEFYIISVRFTQTLFRWCMYQGNAVRINLG